MGTAKKLWAGATIINGSFNLGLGMIQVTLLLVAWTHGCIGMYLWLRLRPFFPRVAPLLLAGAVLLPSLALLGFYQQGRTVLRLAQDPQWQAEYRSVSRIGTAAQRATLATIRDNFLYAWGAAIGFVFIARGLVFFESAAGARFD